jgi:hypothetical protein
MNEQWVIDTFWKNLNAIALTGMACDLETREPLYILDQETA